MTIYHNDGQKKDALNEAFFQLETHPDFAHVPELIEELYGNRKSWDELIYEFEEKQERIHLLEQSLLRLLCAIDREHGLKQVMALNLIEVQTAKNLTQQTKFGFTSTFE